MSEVDVIGQATQQFSLDPDSAKTLREVLSQACRDRDEVFFDDRELTEFEENLKSRRFVAETREYLRTLRTEEGVPFCRSVVQHKKARAQLDNFLKPDPPNNMYRKVVQTAFHVVLSRYQKANLAELPFRSQAEVADSIPRKDTSCGFDRFVSPGKWHKKKEALEDPEFYAWFLNEEEQARVHGTFGKPYTPITRTQVSGAFNRDGSYTHTCKVKPRYAMCDSLARSVSAQRYVGPLESFLKDYSHSAIGKSDSYITKWVNVRRARGWSWISLDFSKYDSTIPAWLLEAAFAIARVAFREMDDDLFDAHKRDYIHKTLILKDEWLEIHHGTPSGNRFTSVINGIVNELITETVIARFRLTADYMVMGDDNLLYLKHAVSAALVKVIAEFISATFGIQCHPEKCRFGNHFEDPEFLSSWWTSRGRRRPMGEILSLALYPERWRNYEETDAEGVKLRTPGKVFEGYWVCYPLDFEDYLKPNVLARGTIHLDLNKLSYAELESMPWRLQKKFELDGTLGIWVSASKREMARRRSLAS